MNSNNTNNKLISEILSSDHYEDARNNLFYKEKNGVIPLDIIDDFDNDSNFLFIFVNPTSGSQEGKQIFEYIDRYREASIKDYNIIHFPVVEENDWIFTPTLTRSNSTQSLEEIKIKGTEHPTKFDASIPFTIIVFNIIDKIDYKKGKFFIKNYINDFPEQEIKIIIGGGDGSVLSIIEDLNKDKINLKKCKFGVMPLGTGNDLSNSMGFGYECEIGIKIEYFQRVLYTYLTASDIYIDIWQLQTEVDKNLGTISEIDHNKEKILNDNENNQLKNLQKTFINYMSIGFDAMVGFRVGQMRTGSRFLNKIIYFWESAKDVFKGLVHKNLGLPSLLESFEEENELNETKKLIFKTKDKEKGKIEKGTTILRGNPIVIVCQNIDFYLGGLENIWKNSKKIGIQVIGLKKKEKKEFEEKIMKTFDKQSCSDKKVEFFTYDHLMDMGLDKLFGIRAKKVHQGSGPFYFTFKKNPSKSQKKKLNKVYINIDGEFFHLVQPKEIIIKQNKEICDGQIKFLKNEIGIWKLKKKTGLQKIKKNLKYYKFLIINFVFTFLAYYVDKKSAIIFLLFVVLLHL